MGPKKYDSFHCAITEKELAPFRDAWIKEFRDNRGLQIHAIGAAGAPNRRFQATASFPSASSEPWR